MLIPNYSKSCALRWLISTVIFTIHALHTYTPHNPHTVTLIGIADRALLSPRAVQ